MATQPGAAWVKNGKGDWVKPKAPTSGGPYKWNDTSGWVKKKTEADFAAEYGPQAALVNSDRSLQALFKQAVAEEWSADKFKAKFLATPWAQTHSDTWRVAEASRISDPASWAEQRKLVFDNIRRQYSDLGFQLDESQISNLADQSLYLSGGTAANVDNAVLKSHIAEIGRITGTGGTALTTIDTLKKNAYNYGVSYGDEWFNNAAKSILTGTGEAGNATYWNNIIKNNAKSQLPGLSDLIDSGLDARTAADGYITKMASTFELDPSEVNLQDPLMQKAFTNIGQDGKPSLKPLWQFQQELKQDNRYFKTNKAHQDMTGLATEIARQFGRA
jgi:hypothetical protein